MFGSRFMFGGHAEHRRDAADGAADDRRDVPAGRRESVGVLGGVGFVEHYDDHIARVIHREHTCEARDVDRLAIVAVDQLLRGAGLAADAIAGRIGLLASPLHHHEAQERAHLVARVFGEHPAAGAERVVRAALQDRRRMIDAAVEQGRVAHRELKRRNRDALAEADRHRFERPPARAGCSARPRSLSSISTGRGSPSSSATPSAAWCRAGRRSAPCRCSSFPS